MTAFTFRDLAFVSGRRLLYPTYVQDYLDRVTAADVAAGNTLGLELSVTDAFNTCLQAMVADTSLGVSGGVLAQAASLIKASCAMQGARTLPGALVPLAADMPAPTNFNFVGGDYSRRTGLMGNGSTKWLNSNRNNNADPQNNNHRAAYVSTASTTSGTIGPNIYPTVIGCGEGANGACAIGRFNAGSTSGYTRNNCSAFSTDVSLGTATGAMGISRSSSNSYTLRFSGSNTTINATSQTPISVNLGIYDDVAVGNVASVSSYMDGRIAFYSIGSALDLAILDARITALSNAIQAAIAP